MPKSKKVASQARPVTPFTRPTKQLSAQKLIPPTIPFHNEDRILLIGEGDLAFARSIIESHGCGDVTATCHEDDRDSLLAKHPQARSNLDFLEAEESPVLMGVDATALDKHKKLKKSGLYDKIIFNFPLVDGKESTDVNRQVRANQELLAKFFASAIPFLANVGTIVVTTYEVEPYTLWNIKDLARHSGLAVQRSFVFQASAYPEYAGGHPSGAVQEKTAVTKKQKPARSYIFETPKSQVKRGRAGENDDDDDDD